MAIRNGAVLICVLLGPPEGFEPHHGVGGPKGDGNVFLEDNILAFQRHVLENTNRLGNQIQIYGDTWIYLACSCF